MHQFQSCGGGLKALIALQGLVNMDLRASLRMIQQSLERCTDHRRVEFVDRFPAVLILGHYIDLVVLIGSAIPDLAQDMFRVVA